MGGANHIGQVEQRAVCCRLHFEHIEGCPGHMTRFQRLGQSDLIDQTTAGAVDDPHTGFHLGNRLSIQNIAGLLGFGHMQCDEIGPRQKLVQVHFLHAQFFGPLLGEEGIIGHNLHLEAQGTLTDDAANITRANHAKGLARKLYPHEFGFFPFPRVGRGAGLRNLPRHSEHHRNGVFCGGDHIAKGRVHHDHTFFGGSGPVDIIHTDASPANHL